MLLSELSSNVSSPAKLLSYLIRKCRVDVEFQANCLRVCRSGRRTVADQGTQHARVFNSVCQTDTECHCGGFYLLSRVRPEKRADLFDSVIGTTARTFCVNRGGRADKKQGTFHNYPPKSK